MDFIVRTYNGPTYNTFYIPRYKKQRRVRCVR